MNNRFSTLKQVDENLRRHLKRGIYPLLETELEVEEIGKYSVDGLTDPYAPVHMGRFEAKLHKKLSSHFVIDPEQHATA